ncbi:cysteine peptidase family C39 domain-containing protein [Limosilactobacillus reuteri]|uniref:cysteine peptidase family C39 domain-containing protein n=1 Tax=Limosilactobacillus reuteri TaxID=1598 RepID=UPI002B4BA517|nr:cysteine peptidase family C39 domain-containing protein [Limosilactobacillus reuteri]
MNQVNKTDCRLATVLHNYGSKISLATLRKFTKTTTDGTTALRIVKAAEKLKMNVEAYQADASLFDSKDVIYPFIAHLMKNITSHSLILMVYPIINVSVSQQVI